MRRRSQPKPQAGGVSLFPFLAVLLCTMGALIVVLIVIARQARIQVAEDDGDSPLRSELETQKADLEWRIEMLRESRTKTLEQLETQRQELSHLEDHSRRLRNQLEELEHARREFEKLAAGGDVESDRLKREIDEIGAKIASKQRELDDAIKKGGKGGQSYAVVPYHGPNETRRRPIYIECRSDGVVFQPEGLVLTEKDFEGDLGPSNPLVSALRAAREYLSRNQLPGEEGAAYPLLLVRPDGIVAYECVLKAMESWGSEFGYELVGDDWNLEFPVADPKLTLAMRQAIGEGRLRQAYLAHAAPRLRSSGHHSFRASPTGGLMRDDGMPLDAEAQMARRGGGPSRPSWARGGRYGASGASGGSSGRDQAKTANKRGANPYAAALHSQSAPGGAGGGSGTTLGSGENTLLGVGAGDLAGGQLNAAPGSPTGVLFTAPEAGGPNGGAGSSLLGSGRGSSATPSSNLLAGGAGKGGGGPNISGGPARGANGYGGPAAGGRGMGPAGKPGGGAGKGGAPGTRAASGRGCRGWGGGQDKIDAVAASLGAGSGDSLASNASGRGLQAAGAPGAGEMTGTKAGASGGGNAGAAGPDLRPAQSSGNAASGNSATGNLAGAEAASDSLSGGPAAKPGGKEGGKFSKGSASDGSASAGDGGGSADGVASAGSSSQGTGSNSKASTGSMASSGGQTGAQAAGGGGGSGQPQQPGAMAIPGMPNMTLGQQPQQKSIADQRGEKNWANPAANRAAFPVTRPIKIVCDADHLTMLPEGRGRRGYKVIEFGERNEDNVRELVTSVWDRIDTWGAAGQGMYWRPELIMEVEPGAEERFNALKALMADSGLDVRGRPRSATAVRYPRTKTPN